MADPTIPSGGYYAELVEQIEKLWAHITDLESPSGTQRARVANRLPTLFMKTGRRQSFGLTTGWATYATVSVPVPEGKRQLQLLATGMAGVLDMTSGGVTTSYGRIVINGVVSPEFPASKDSGSNFVNNVIQASSVADIDVSQLTAVSVEFQLQPLNAAAYATHVQNFAQLAVNGSFTIA